MNQYINPALSVQANPDGTIQVYWYARGSAEREVEIVLDPWAALGFMRDLARGVSYALDDALDAATIGPCERCGNARLVDVERPHGGTESVHCDECADRRRHLRERYAASVFTLRATCEALS